MKLKGPSALLFSNNEEQETSTETKVKPRRGLGCGREAQGSGGPAAPSARGTCPSLPPRHAVRAGVRPSRRRSNGRVCRGQEDSRWPLLPCAAGSAGVGGGRPSPFLPPCPSCRQPWLCNSCSGLCGGGGRSCCWTLLVNPR